MAKPLSKAQHEALTLMRIGEAIRATLAVAPMRERDIVKNLATVPGVTEKMVEDTIRAYDNAGWVVRKKGKLYGMGYVEKLADTLENKKR